MHQSGKGGQGLELVLTSGLSKTGGESKMNLA